MFFLTINGELLYSNFVLQWVSAVIVRSV